MRFRHKTNEASVAIRVFVSGAGKSRISLRFIRATCYFVDPFTRRFLTLLQQLEMPLTPEFWQKVGIPNPGGHSFRSARQDTLLHAALEKLKEQLRSPLGDKEWRKIAWLYDRIAAQLGVPRANSYPRVLPVGEQEQA